TAKKKVVINGGGSFTEWSKDGITHGTNGYWLEHAAAHLMAGPKKQSQVFNESPATRYDDKFELTNTDKSAQGKVQYQLRRDDDHTETGRTGTNQPINQQKSEAPDSVKHFIKPVRKSGEQP
ncbi:DUF2345 domain-containing protein, partial [Sapientia aquatica]